jgi:hypothetical protein
MMPEPPHLAQPGYNSSVIACCVAESRGYVCRMSINRRLSGVATFGLGPYLVT